MLLILPIIPKSFWIHPSGVKQFSKATENEVSETEETRFGIRFVIDGPLSAPDGTVLNVRSAWFIDAGGETPRFVTAHPLPKP
jgi:hypothetical protein